MYHITRLLHALWSNADNVISNQDVVKISKQQYKKDSAIEKPCCPNRVSQEKHCRKEYQM